MSVLFAIPTTTAFSKPQLPTSPIKASESRVINIHKFLPMIDAGIIYCCITYYQKHIEFHIIIISKVCYYYEFFVYPLSLFIILRSDLIVVAVFNKNTINMAFLNYYS